MISSFRRLAAMTAFVTVALAGPALAQQPHYRFNNYQLGLTASIDVGAVAGQQRALTPCAGTPQQTWVVALTGTQ